jgi:hypothetical protein
MANRKGYATVYWGKMPVNFRPRAFRRSEVEEAVRQAERDFPDVLELVPDFRRVEDREEGNLPELLRRVARHVRLLRGRARPPSRSSTV